MCELQRLQKSDRRSLGCIKPQDVDQFIIEEADPNWTGKKQDTIDQLALFDPVETKLEKIPFVFKYHYRCESRDCRGHTQSIIDWELMELYRKVRDKRVPPKEIAEEIRKRFLGELCSPSRDTHFFVGNHSRFPATFMILGVFWPPRSTERELF